MCLFPLSLITDFPSQLTPNRNQPPYLQNVLCLSQTLSLPPLTDCGLAHVSIPCKPLCTIKWGSNSTSHLTGRLGGFGDIVRVRCTAGSWACLTHPVNTSYYCSSGVTPLNKEATPWAHLGSGCSLWGFAPHCQPEVVFLAWLLLPAPSMGFGHFQSMPDPC